MKVQELIDKLQEIKDKEAEIKMAYFIEARTIYADIDNVKEKSPLDLGCKCWLIYSE